MKTYIWKGIIAMICFNLMSCTQSFENEIEADLQIHFDNFIQEASYYGKEISLDEIDIDAYIQSIEERGTLGQCKSYSNGSKQVVIDQQFWNRASTLEREYIVFHELGHCILDRDHDDSRDANGNCLSIMQSGDNACEGNYTSQNRNSLLIELFDF